MLKDFLVRSEEACFIIRYRPLLTKYFNNFLRLTKIVSWHGCEQMVLDLAAELTEEEIGKAIRQKVSCGDDLLMEKVHLFNQRHPFMIRGKRHAKVEAKKRLVDKKEHDAMYRPQKVNQKSNVEHKMHREEDSFSVQIPPVFPTTDQKINTVYAEVD